MSAKGDAKIVPRISSSLSIKGLTKSVDVSIATMLERESEEEVTPWPEELRLRVKKIIATSFFGHLYVNTLLVLSILSCLQYLYSTYLESTPRGLVIPPRLTRHPSRLTLSQRILHIFSYLELSLASLFAFDWCLNLFIADHKSEFFFRSLLFRSSVSDRPLASSHWWTSQQ
jgi:hypothetical protein